MLALVSGLCYVFILQRLLWPWDQVHSFSLELGSDVFGATSGVLEDSHVSLFS